MRIFVTLTEGWYFCSHFWRRALAAQAAGHEVTVIARMGTAKRRILDHGFGAIDFEVGRRSVNPFDQIAKVRALAAIYRREKPDLAHHVALKPVIIGGLAARLARTPRIVNALTGMGYAFTSQERRARYLLRPAAMAMLRLTLGARQAVTVFQNSDDLEEIVGAGLAPRGRTALIRGSGVDLHQFQPHTGVRWPGAPRIMLAARMLWDKGVREFVEAARILRAQGVDARMLLVGDTDADNPTCVPTELLRAWSAEGVIEWLGRRDDMPALLRDCDIACLPSYREGLPRALLEALAAGLPIVTTDTQGCRDIVADGANGLLVPVGDAPALAEAIARLARDPALRREMGVASRALAEREFSAPRIIAETLAVYERLGAGWPAPTPASSDAPRGLRAFDLRDDGS